MTLLAKRLSTPTAQVLCSDISKLSEVEFEKCFQAFAYRLGVPTRPPLVSARRVVAENPVSITFHFLDRFNARPHSQIVNIKLARHCARLVEKLGDLSRNSAIDVGSPKIDLLQTLTMF